MGCCQLKAHRKNSIKESKFTYESEAEPVPHKTTISNLVSLSSGKINEDYIIIRVIGEGGYGQVKEVVEKKTGCKRAMKSIQIKFMKKSEVENIEREVKTLKNLDHPGVLKIFQVYRESDYFHIITDLCTGGELFEKIVKQKKLSENQAASYMFDIVSTVKYLHESGIMHRDLKPDNILFEDTSPGSRLKIIDFGASKSFRKGKTYDDIVGTPYYIAPEVLLSQYTQKCDIWSIGIILYTILCGSPPFTGSSNAEIYENILEEPLAFKSPNWSSISSSAKSLIKKVLVKDPNKRISISEFLFDPWLQTRSSDLVPDRDLSQASMLNLSRFKQINKLQGCTFVYLAHCFTTSNELKHIRKLFESFDKNGDGKLSVEEIKEGISKFNDNLQIDAEEVMKNCDLDKNGFIDYSEFLAGVCSTNLEITKKKLKSAFDAMDSDGSGKLSRVEMRQALIGMTCEKTIMALATDMDTNFDGEIDFEEFAKAILNRGLKGV